MEFKNFESPCNYSRYQIVGLHHAHMVRRYKCFLKITNFKPFAIYCDCRSLRAFQRLFSSLKVTKRSYLDKITLEHSDIPYLRQFKKIWNVRKNRSMKKCMKFSINFKTRAVSVRHSLALTHVFTTKYA